MGLSSQIRSVAAAGVMALAGQSFPQGGGGVRIVKRLTDGDQDAYEHGMAYYSNAFRACLLAKARPLAALPVHVYKREDGVRKSATGGFPLKFETILRGRWNPFMTAAECERWAIMTKDTLGNAFIRIERDRGGMITALWPLADKPNVDIDSHGRPVFRYGGDKFTKQGNYLYNEIVWIKSPILDEDGLYGVSLADLAARELNLSINLEEFYQRLLRNGSHFPGWLETDQKLDRADVDDIKQQLSDGSGIVSAGKVRLFDKGLKYHQTNLTMADMSLVDQERWILQQTCRTLSVPPQEVFDLSNATYSNIEQGALNFAQKTLVPECVTLEQALNWVLQSSGHPDYYVQFDMNGLLRGSYRERMEGYRTAIYAGMFSPNDALAKEDMAPYKGGDVKFRSTAYIPVDPDTGEELAPRTSVREPGSAGEGGQGDSGSGTARSTDPGSSFEDEAVFIKRDMDERVTARFAEKGDCQEARDFAAKVLGPYASACLMNRIPYDIDSDIERLAQHARH